MRILMLAQFYPPVIGGEERHVRNLSVELAARGHEVHVGTFDLTAAPGELDDPGVTVHLLPNAGRRLPFLYTDPARPLAMPLPDPVLTAALWRLVRQIEPDVVHAHNWIVNSYLPIRAVKKTPLVLSLHDYSHVCATKRLMYKEKPCSGPAVGKCLECAGEHYGQAIGTTIWSAVRTGRRVREHLVDHFASVSRYVQDANGLASAPESRASVVPNFVPDALGVGLGAAETVARDEALPAGEFIFFAGDLSAQKGAHTLIRAHAMLPTPRPALVLVGRQDGQLPERLADDVLIHQGWAHERVVSGFAHCLLAALPSEWPDPCPTTVLEALALGAALVTTTEGGIADMVTDGESALVVPAGEPAAMAAALARLSSDAHLRAALSAGARLAADRFRCGATASAFERIYARLTNDS